MCPTTSAYRALWEEWVLQWTALQEQLQQMLPHEEAEAIQQQRGDLWLELILQRRWQMQEELETKKVHPLRATESPPKDR